MLCIASTIECNIFTFAGNVAGDAAEGDAGRGCGGEAAFGLTHATSGTPFGGAL